MDSEQEAIRRTLQDFFDGVDNLDAQLIKSALYPDQRSYYVSSDGTVGGLAYSEWEDYLNTIRRDPDHPLCREKSRKEIDYIDLTGTAAAAKARLIFSDCTFVDYYSLIKVGGRWQITNTTFAALGFDPINPGRQ